VFSHKGPKWHQNTTRITAEIPTTFFSTTNTSKYPLWVVHWDEVCYLQLHCCTPVMELSVTDAYRNSRVCCCQWHSRVSTFSAPVRVPSPRPPQPYRRLHHRITSALRRRQRTTVTKQSVALAKRKAFERCRFPKQQCQRE